MLNRSLKFFLLFIFSLCTACASVPVAEDVSQAQATEIVAVLTASGISSQAAKGSGAKAAFSVSVDKSDYLTAVTILHDRGLPSPEEATFADAIAARGFLPNSRDIEALRIDRALAAELEDLIKAHPAVASARAVVRWHAAKEQPNVSMVVQQKVDSVIERDALTEIALRAIPGINREQIFISISTLPPIQPISEYRGNEIKESKVINIPLVPFLYFWKIPQRELASLSVLLLSVVVVIGAIGTFLGYWLGVIQQTRASLDQQQLEMSVELRKALDKPRDPTEGQ